MYCLFYFLCISENRSVVHKGRLISVTVQEKIEFQRGLWCNHKISLQTLIWWRTPELHLVFNILKWRLIMMNMSPFCFVLLLCACDSLKKKHWNTYILFIKAISPDHVMVDFKTASRQRFAKDKVNQKPWLCRDTWFIALNCCHTFYCGLLILDCLLITFTLITPHVLCFRLRGCTQQMTWNSRKRHWSTAGY